MNNVPTICGQCPGKRGVLRPKRSPQFDSKDAWFMLELLEGSVFMRKVYDVHFVDKDGLWNHKILEAGSELEVSVYMSESGFSEFSITER